MHQAKRKFLRNAAKIFDAIALLASFAVTVIILSPQTWKGIDRFLAIRIRLANVLIFSFIVICWHYIFALCGLYISKRLSTRQSELGEVFRATSLAGLFLYLTGIVFHLQLVKPSFVLGFWFLSTIVIVSGRSASWLILGTLRMRGLNPRFILIIGTNQRAVQFAKGIEARPELGYRLVGFVDDEWTGLEVFRKGKYRLRCDFAGLAEFIRKSIVDEVAIFLPLRSYYEHAARLAQLCEQQGIPIRFDAKIFDLKIAKSAAEDLEESRQIRATSDVQEGWAILVKRLVDIVISLVLLILLVPLFLLIAIATKLNSRGPVFFAQNRVGLNKRFFKMFKFRTMVPHAEQIQEQLAGLNEMSGPVFKIKDDPRITPMGAVLRKLSLDELPQLWNVLRGDMSLVGPRAMSVRDYQHFNQDWQRRRFSIRPGITCLWQVNGRNNVPFDRWMELDMQYIDTWSLWLDLKILLRTIPAVLRGTGAV